MTNDLKQHLQANPHIHTVYVNNQGQWLFHSRPGYDKALSRDEVLKMKVASETPVAENIAKQTQAGIIPAVVDTEIGTDVNKLRDEIRAELLEELKPSLDKFQNEQLEFEVAKEELEAIRAELTSAQDKLAADRAAFESEKGKQGADHKGAKSDNKK